MSEGQFKGIVERAADGILVVDADGTIRFANPASEFMLGRTADELIGTALGQPVVVDGATELGVLRKDGTLMMVEMRASEISWDGAPAMLASLRDVSDRLRIKEQIEHLNSVLRAIRSINQLIVHEHDPSALMQRACELLIESRGYSGAWITVDGGANTPVTVGQAGWGENHKPFAALHTQAELPPCVKGDCIVTEGFMLHEDAVACEGCTLSGICGQNTALIVPLRHDQQILGFLGVTFPGDVIADDEECALLTEVADDVAFGLHVIQTGRVKKENEERFQTIAESSADAIFVSDPGKPFSYVNKTSARLLGYSVDELLRMRPEDLFSDHYLSMHGERRKKLLENGKASYETCFVRKDGTEVYVDVNAVVLPNGFIYASCRDISERKRAAEELNSSGERFRALFANSLVPIVIADDEGRYLDANPAACEFFGYNREQLRNMRVSDWVTPMTKSAADRFEEYKRTSASSGEFSFVRPDGKQRVALWSAAKISDGEHASVLRDITDLKAYEHHLREEKERAQSYLDVAAVMFIGCDPNGHITIINRRGCEVLGVPNQEDAIGTDWFQFIPQDERDESRAKHGAIMRGDIEAHRRVEGRVLTANGERRSIVWHNAVVHDALGNIVGCLSSGEDVTERRDLESQLAQADRLTSMGMLAAGVAHEINNPLAYVLYNLESLTVDLASLMETLREVQDEINDAPGVTDRRMLNPAILDDMHDRFREALSGSRRIKNIARGLGSFSRVEKDRLVSVNLMHVIEAAVNLAFNEIKYRARLVKDYGKTPTIYASEGRLSQVFLNLIINAAHSIEEGDPEENEIRVRTWTEDDMVCAEVRDSGSGIKPENLTRLFEPFFTTKKIGTGSGLGLSISKSIIEEYGGTIVVTTELGEGTSFIIRLPVRHAAVEPIPEAAAASVGAAPASEIVGRILIVDDEPYLRSAVTRILVGHDLVQAASGAEAQRILEGDQAFDLILCDMMMSDVSGMEVHEWLAEQYPELAERLIFLTGGAFTPNAREYLAKVDSQTIEKPFEVADLKKLVNDAVRLHRQDSEV